MIWIVMQELRCNETRLSSCTSYILARIENPRQRRFGNRRSQSPVPKSIAPGGHIAVGFIQQVYDDAILLALASLEKRG